MNKRTYLSELDQNLNKSAIFKRYQDIRNEHSEIINEMFHDIALHPEKYESILIQQNACQFPLDPTIPEHAQLLAELLLYPHLKDGLCVTQVYLEEHKMEEHRDLLISMLESRCSLFRYIERNNDTGVVTLYDVVNDETIEIVDKHFGVGQTGSVYYVGRVISYNGINFLTGLNYFFPINKNMNKYMKTIINDFHFKNSCDVIVKLYHYNKQHGLK